MKSRLNLNNRPIPIVGASILFVLTALLQSCEKTTVSSPPEHQAITTEALEPYECGTISRLHTQGGIFLASQPSAADFQAAKDGGVKTIINLRKPEENTEFDEAKIISDLGLGYHNPAWNKPEELTDDLLDNLRALLKNEEHPVMLHCKSANRVGAVWLAYRALDDNIPVDDAIAEAKTVGLKSPDFEAKVKDYIARKQAE